MQWLHAPPEPQTCSFVQQEESAAHPPDECPDLHPSTDSSTHGPAQPGLWINPMILCSEQVKGDAWQFPTVVSKAASAGTWLCVRKVCGCRGEC